MRKIREGGRGEGLAIILFSTEEINPEKKLKKIKRFEIKS